VARKEVYIMGYRDYFPDRHDEEISKLDVFFALTKTFDLYETKKAVGVYANPYLNMLALKLAKMKGSKRPDNIIVMEIPDYGVHEGIYSIILGEIVAGKRVGFGCYGAHGRTGWVLARLIKDLEGLDGDEAVFQTRKRLCHECVESEEQIRNLGCKVAVANRLPLAPATGGYYGGYMNGLDHGDYPISTGRGALDLYPKTPDVYHPVHPDPLVDRPLLADYAAGIRMKQEKGAPPFDPTDPFAVFGD
jgi:hypothetical protein